MDGTEWHVLDQCCGSRTGLHPDSIRSMDPDPGGQKWPTKIEKASPVALYVIYEGLGTCINWKFWNKKIFSSNFLSVFGSSNPWIRIRIDIHLKCWIRIRIKLVGIRNTVLNDMKKRLPAWRRRGRRRACRGSFCRIWGSASGTGRSSVSSDSAPAHHSQHYYRNTGHRLSLLNYK